jgi:hypothetical protein
MVHADRPDRQRRQGRRDALGRRCASLAGQRLGVGRYIEYLVKHWRSMMEADDRCTLFMREPYDGSAWEPSPSIRVRAFAPSVPPSVWQHGVLPRFTADVDVLFCPELLRTRARMRANASSRSTA